MTPELQPIILAAGEGSKMFPLTEKLPKCLLPIGNVPLIWYPVNYLENCGFQGIDLSLYFMCICHLLMWICPYRNLGQKRRLPLGDKLFVRQTFVTKKFQIKSFD